MAMQIIECAILGIVLMAVCTVVISSFAYYACGLLVIGAGMLAALGALPLLALFAVTCSALLIGAGGGYLIGRRMATCPWVPTMMAAMSGQIDIAATGQKAASIAHDDTLRRPQRWIASVRAPLPILLGAMQLSLKRWLAFSIGASLLIAGPLILAGVGAGTIATEVLDEQTLKNLIRAVTCALCLAIVAEQIVHRTAPKRAVQ